MTVPYIGIINAVFKLSDVNVIHSVLHCFVCVGPGSAKIMSGFSQLPSPTRDDSKLLE